jgi:hypothetical protein
VHDHTDVVVTTAAAVHGGPFIAMASAACVRARAWMRVHSQARLREQPNRRASGMPRCGAAAAAAAAEGARLVDLRARLTVPICDRHLPTVSPSATAGARIGNGLARRGRADACLVEAEAGSVGRARAVRPCKAHSFNRPVVPSHLAAGPLPRSPTIQIQYNAIQYNTIQYNTIQYNTIQYTPPVQRPNGRLGGRDRRKEGSRRRAIPLSPLVLSPLVHSPLPT